MSDADGDADVDARLFHRLHGYWPDGYTPPAVNGDDSYDPSAYDALAADTTPAASPLKGRLLTLDQLAKLPPPTPVVDGLLDLDSTSVVYGRRDSYKSFIALDMGLSVASGIAWQGHDTRQGVALYVAAEGVSGLDQRVRAWRDRHPNADPADRMLILPEPVNLLNVAAVSEAASVAADIGAVLVIIDTLARSMFGGDENSAKDVGLAVAGMDIIRRRTGAHVAVVHHSGKDPKAGARGSSALEAAADTVLEVAAADSRVTITTTKQKNRAKGDPVRLAPVITDVSVVLELSYGEPEPVTDKVRHALKALDEIAGNIGASMSSWVDAAEDYDVSKRTVMRVRIRALNDGWIEVPSGAIKGRPVYVVTAAGSAIVAGTGETGDDQDF